MIVPSLATSHPAAKSPPAPVTAIAISIGLLLAAVVVALLFGTESTSLYRAISEPESLDRLILLRARLPRVALAAVTGAGLSVTGAALQALLRNPLAEPYLLGVSGGAAVGASAAILLGLSALSILGALIVPLAALCGGLAATLLVYALARSVGNLRREPRSSSVGSSSTRCLGQSSCSPRRWPAPPRPKSCSFG